VDPTANDGDAGVTEIEEREGVTVSAAAPWMPLRVAVMVAEPAETPVARPVAFTVAVAGLELVHVTLPVTLVVDPSL
jgi:hypothetical protein